MSPLTREMTLADLQSYLDAVLKKHAEDVNLIAIEHEMRLLPKQHDVDVEEMVQHVLRNILRLKERVEERRASIQALREKAVKERPFGRDLDPRGLHEKFQRLLAHISQAEFTLYRELRKKVYGLRVMTDRRVLTAAPVQKEE